MTSSDIRQQFISFFEKKGHKVVPSAPVVPHGDPTLIFTNAGMNQFKDIFLGYGNRDYDKAVDSQKCIRVSGKHNDLEEVGVDHYHHTFFEMLGNWSFGDYYKKEAIAYAWELLTEVWGLDTSRLYATVYRTDDESFEYWKKYLPEDRILRFDEKDNFWEMGETGPCGPSSEIHYDNTSDKSGRELVNAGHEDVIEIWNLVFIEFNRNEAGELENLASKHVDTGMGFERITRILQGKSSNYDTDIFEPLLKEIAKITGAEYKGSASQEDIAFRVIADHIRTLAFSIADGAIPGSDGRGYVLRRILRRASRYASKLGLQEPILYKLVEPLAVSMGSQFPELNEQKDIIVKIIKAEEQSFLQTLQKGIERFETIVKDSEGIKGADIFQLYDTFGFPPDLTTLMAKEAGKTADMAGFEKHMKEQKERSRSTRKTKSASAEELELEYQSTFTGYESIEGAGKVLWKEGNRIVVDSTPFYAEKGGQISDTGKVIANGNEYEVISVKSHQDAVIIELDREFDGDTGATVSQKIDKGKRDSIRKNHSATHLLHAALYKVLGSHIQQQGSLVTDKYLRFDYNHFEKPSVDQLREIEGLVNRQIFAGEAVNTKLMSLEEAQSDKSIRQFFGDKYGSVVRAVSMGTIEEGAVFSSELCGGTHVANTSEIGMFLITSDSSIASGIRRIEAVTGEGAYSYHKKLLLEKDNILLDIQEKDQEIKKLEKEIKSLGTSGAGEDLESDIDKASKINGITVFVKQIDGLDAEQLRELGDKTRNILKEQGIGLIASVTDGKIMLVCISTDDIKGKYPAGKLVGLAAKKLGGGGGGKPHMATAGGRDLSALPALIEKGFDDIVAEWAGQ